MNNADTPMCTCLKFDGCSAPICPLDPDWPRRVHRKGEPVCFYLLEYVKPGARARFEGSMAIALYHAMERSIDALCTRHAPIRKALARAKRTGSRLNTHPVSEEGEFVPVDDPDIERPGAPAPAVANVDTGDQIS